MNVQMTDKEMKTAENKRRKKGNVDDDEPDMDALDWWSKYFASVETMIRVGPSRSFFITCSAAVSVKRIQVRDYIEGFRPEWCISAIYHA